MTPSELRQTMRQRQKELRQTLRRVRRQARERIGQIPAVRRERTRRRLGRAIGVALLILLSSFMRCDCHPSLPPPTAEKIVTKSAAAMKVKVATPAQPPKREPLRAQIETQPRAGYLGYTRESPTWIDDFRLQVGARSPRLAQCFTDTDRPGMLRWTAAVNPESGAVSDHEIEPLGTSSELRREQRDCLIRALSSPTYRLNASKQQALPNRISLLIEF